MAGKSGWGKLEEKKEEAKEAKVDGLYPPQRFFMGYDEKRRVTFLDCDRTETVLEHAGERLKLQLPYIYREAKIRGDHRPSFFTQPDEPCCIPKKDFRDVVAFTIIDHSSYQGKNRLYKDEKKLLVAQVWMPLVDMIKAFADANGGLRGLTLTLGRSSNQTSPAVGDQVLPTVQEYEGGLPDKVKNGGDFEESTQHANYLKWLAPKTPAEIAHELGHGAPPQAPQDDDASLADASIPF